MSLIAQSATQSPDCGRTAPRENFEADGPMIGNWRQKKLKSIDDRHEASERVGSTLSRSDIRTAVAALQVSEISSKSLKGESQPNYHKIR